MTCRFAKLVSLGLALTIGLTIAAVWPTARLAAAPGDNASEAAADDSAPAPKAAPWIGLRITPVPDALAAHLPLADGRRGRPGVMVRNVVADGPADRAGLEQYDVIIGLGRDQVVDAMGRFVRQISRFRPGQTVTFTLLRGGKEQTVELTVGDSATDRDADYRYKYPEAPSGVLREQRNFEGAVITRQADGWQWQDFQEADARVLQELPPEMLQRLRQFAALAASSRPTERTVIRRGDRTVEIMREEQGRVTVRTRRHDADAQPGDALVQTYASAAAFRDADPQAFELQARLADEPLLPPTEASETANDDSSEATEGQDARAEDQDGPLDGYEAQRRQYEAFLEGYLEYLQERMNDPQAEGQGPPPMMWRALWEDQSEAGTQPERQFTRHPSGRIDVRIRKPSGELLVSFRDAEAMQQKDPQLYEHYQALTADDR